MDGWVDEVDEKVGWMSGQMAGWVGGWIIKKKSWVKFGWTLDKE